MRVARVTLLLCIAAVALAQPQPGPCEPDDGFCSNPSCSGTSELFDCLFCRCACEARGVDCSGLLGLPTLGPDIGEPPGEPETEPSVSSSSTTAIALTSASITCARNCGQPENGGGRCRPTNGKCLSCNENRLLSNGRCYTAIYCRGRRIQTGSTAGNNCRCLNDHCHYCYRTVSGDDCRRCRDGWYHLDGDCVQSCPADMAQSGVNLFGRRCSVPFTCHSGRILGLDVDYGCKCAALGNMAVAPCQTCLHEAGQYGQKCIKCHSGKYLNHVTSQCVDDCVGTGNISYTPGNYGRECRTPFTCTDRRDEDGHFCKCSRTLRLAGCRSCRWDAGGDTCLD